MLISKKRYDEIINGHHNDDNLLIQYADLHYYGNAEFGILKDVFIANKIYKTLADKQNLQAYARLAHSYHEQINNKINMYNFSLDIYNESLKKSLNATSEPTEKINRKQFFEMISGPIVALDDNNNIKHIIDDKKEKEDTDGENDTSEENVWEKQIWRPMNKPKSSIDFKKELDDNLLKLNNVCAKAKLYYNDVVFHGTKPDKNEMLIRFYHNIIKKVRDKTNPNLNSLFNDLKNLCEMCINHGFTYGYVIMAKLVKLLPKYKKRCSKLIKLYEQAHKHNIVKGTFELGMLYFHKKYKNKDIENKYKSKACELIIIAAKAGYHRAISKLKITNSPLSINKGDKLKVDINKFININTIGWNNDHADDENKIKYVHVDRIKEIHNNPLTLALCCRLSFMNCIKDLGMALNYYLIAMEEGYNKKILTDFLKIYDFDWNTKIHMYWPIDNIIKKNVLMLLFVSKYKKLSTIDSIKYFNKDIALIVIKYLMKYCKNDMFDYNDKIDIYTTKF